MHTPSAPNRRPPPVSPYHLTPSGRTLLNLRAAQIRRSLAERRAAREQQRAWGQP